MRWNIFVISKTTTIFHKCQCESQKFTRIRSFENLKSFRNSSRVTLSSNTDKQTSNRYSLAIRALPKLRSNIDSPKIILKDLKPVVIPNFYIAILFPPIRRFLTLFENISREIETGKWHVSIKRHLFRICPKLDAPSSIIKKYDKGLKFSERTGSKILQNPPIRGNKQNQ